MQQLALTQHRFEIGEISETDVYQAQSAVASAEADLSIAQGTLYSDQAAFAQYIGHPPGTLKEPGPATRLIPATLEDAANTAQSEHPIILAAIFRERAQEHQIKQVKGQLLPSLSLNAAYTDSAQASSPFLTQTNDARVIGTLSMPLYEGGSVSAQIGEQSKPPRSCASELTRRANLRVNAFLPPGAYTSRRKET